VRLVHEALLERRPVLCPIRHERVVIGLTSFFHEIDLLVGSHVLQLFLREILARKHALGVAAAIVFTPPDHVVEEFRLGWDVEYSAVENSVSYFAIWYVGNGAQVMIEASRRVARGYRTDLLDASIEHV
jgi:hypothetical protein